MQKDKDGTALAGAISIIGSHFIKEKTTEDVHSAPPVATPRRSNSVPPATPRPSNATTPKKAPRLRRSGPLEKIAMVAKTSKKTVVWAKRKVIPGDKCDQWLVIDYYKGEARDAAGRGVGKNKSTPSEWQQWMAKKFAKSGWQKVAIQNWQEYTIFRKRNKNCVKTYTAKCADGKVHVTKTCTGGTGTTQHPEETKEVLGSILGLKFPVSKSKADDGSEIFLHPRLLKAVVATDIPEAPLIVEDTDLKIEHVQWWASSTKPMGAAMSQQVGRIGGEGKSSSLAWLRTILQQEWGHIAKAVSKIVFEKAGEEGNKLPEWLKNMVKATGLLTDTFKKALKEECSTFFSLLLGDTAPILGQLTVFSTDTGLELHLDLDPGSKRSVGVQIPGGRGKNGSFAQITAEIKGTLVIDLAPLLTKLPVLGGWMIYFLEPPEVSINCVGCGNIQKQILDKGKPLLLAKINEGIADHVVLPKVLGGAIATQEQGVDQSQFANARPLGVMRIVVSGPSISGSYMIVSIGKQTWQTEVANKDMKQTKDFVVYHRWQKVRVHLPSSANVTELQVEEARKMKGTLGIESFKLKFLWFDFQAYSSIWGRAVVVLHIHSIFMSMQQLRKYKGEAAVSASLLGDEQETAEKSRYEDPMYEKLEKVVLNLREQKLSTKTISDITGIRPENLAQDPSEAVEVRLEGTLYFFLKPTVQLRDAKLEIQVAQNCNMLERKYKTLMEGSGSCKKNKIFTFQVSMNEVVDAALESNRYRLTPIMGDPSEVTPCGVGDSVRETVFGGKSEESKIVAAHGGTFTIARDSDNKDTSIMAKDVWKQTDRRHVWKRCQGIQVSIDVEVKSLAQSGKRNELIDSFQQDDDNLVLQVDKQAASENAAAASIQRLVRERQTRQARQVASEDAAAIRVQRFFQGRSTRQHRVLQRFSGTNSEQTKAFTKALDMFGKDECNNEDGEKMKLPCKAQSLAWLEAMLGRMWPYIDEAVKDIIKTNVNFAFGIGRFRMHALKLTQFTLGSRPPTIGPLKVSKIENGLRIHVNFDLTSDVELHLEIGKVGKAGIQGLTIKGIVVIELLDFIDELPVVGGWRLYFLDAPQIDVDFDGILNVADGPFVGGLIRDAIDSVIAKLLVLPNVVGGALATKEQRVDQSAFKRGEPQGVLRVNVVSAKDLLAKNISLTKATSDPYAIISVGGKTLKTGVVWKSLKPNWEILAPERKLRIREHRGCKEMDFVLYDVRQTISVKVKDWDLTTDDLIGRAEPIKVDKAIKDGEVEDLKLFTPRGHPAGTVKLKIQRMDIKHIEERMDIADPLASLDHGSAVVILKIHRILMPAKKLEDNGNLAGIAVTFQGVVEATAMQPKFVKPMDDALLPVIEKLRAMKPSTRKKATERERAIQDYFISKILDVPVEDIADHFTDDVKVSLEETLYFFPPGKITAAMELELEVKNSEGKGLGKIEIPLDAWIKRKAICARALKKRQSREEDSEEGASDKVDCEDPSVLKRTQTFCYRGDVLSTTRLAKKITTDPLSLVSSLRSTLPQAVPGSKREKPCEHMIKVETELSVKFLEPRPHTSRRSPDTSRRSSFSEGKMESSGRSSEYSSPSSHRSSETQG